MAASIKNTLERRAKVTSERSGNKGQAPIPKDSGDPIALNSIRPTKHAAQEISSAPPFDKRAKNKQATDERPRDRTREIPEEIRKRFTQVGNEFFFPDGTRAFTDRGGRITSPSENTEVIRSLIAIAEVRGWTDVTIKGTERFRREAWYAASQAGLEVRGYRPSAYDEARVARSLTRSRESRVSESGPASPEGPTNPTHSNRTRGVEESVRRKPNAGASRLHVGRLADHGAAPYRHDPKNGMSYYVRLETVDGEREIWGVDLSRALRESLTRPQIGDEIGLRAVRRDAVTLQAPSRDNLGKIVGSERLIAHRNRWIVEQRRLFEERAQAARVVRDPKVDPKNAVKGHPELAGTYLKIRASELAAKAIRDPEDRNRFVATVRRALADEVARGEPLTPVRLKEPNQRLKTPRSLEPDQARAR